METKSVRLDLRCEGDDGTRFIVEMQQSKIGTYPNTLSGKNTREKYLMKVFR